VSALGERYAESSAVLAWLLGEEVGRPVREVLRRAELVMRSDPTLVECDRVLIRAVTLQGIDEAAAADRRARLNVAAAHWHLWRVSSDIVDRARHTFPAEPVRVELLSLDDRIRSAGVELGFRLQPE